MVSAINDPARLRAVARTGLLDAPASAPLDRIASIVAAALDAPVGLVSLVTDERQFFAGSSGLDEPLSSERQTPLDLSFCANVVERGGRLVVPNSHDDPEFARHPAVLELGVIAYAGTPLRDRDGHLLGSLCVLDHIPRSWTPRELATLDGLGTLTTDLL